MAGARRITEEGEDDMALFSWCGKPQVCIWATSWSGWFNESPAALVVCPELDAVNAAKEM